VALSSVQDFPAGGKPFPHWEYRMQRLPVTFFGSLVTILFIPVILQGATFTDPDIPNGQTLHYRYQAGEYKNKHLIEVRQREEVLGNITRIRVKQNGAGAKTYRIDDSGSRRNGYRFEHISTLRVDPAGLVPVGFQTWDLNPQGRVIRRFEAFFDDPALAYPPDTYPVYSILQVLRGMPFQENTTVPFYIWAAPTEIFRMTFDIIRKETVEVPAGKIPCYYGEMKPDIRTIVPVGNFLAKLLAPFIPRYHFWFSCEPSHPLVKFEGVLGGAGAAPHTIELMKIEAPGPENTGDPLPAETGAPLHGDPP
jgi:hypothetical protein